MNSQTIGRNCRIVSAMLFIAVTCVAPALAQDEAAAASADKSSWVLGYALVFLGIVLGVVAICRPGNRSTDVRTEE